MLIVGIISKRKVNIMNVIKDVKFKILDKYEKRGLFGRVKRYFVLQVDDDRTGNEPVQEQMVSIDSYYKFEKGQQGCMDMFEHSDGLYRYYEED